MPRSCSRGCITRSRGSITRRPRTPPSATARTRCTCCTPHGAALASDCEIVAEDATRLVDGLRRIVEREAADLLVLGPHRGVTGAQSALPEVLRGVRCAVAIAGQQPLSDPLVIDEVGVARCAAPLDEVATHVAAGVADRHGAALRTHSVSSEPDGALVAFAKTVDLLTIGASTHGVLRRRGPGTLPEQLSMSCPCALLIVAGPAGLGDA